MAYIVADSVVYLPVFPGRSLAGLCTTLRPLYSLCQPAPPPLCPLRPPTCTTSSPGTSRARRPARPPLTLCRADSTGPSPWGPSPRSHEQVSTKSGHLRSSPTAYTRIMGKVISGLHFFHVTQVQAYAWFLLCDMLKIDASSVSGHHPLTNANRSVQQHLTQPSPVCQVWAIICISFLQGFRHVWLSMWHAEMDVGHHFIGLISLAQRNRSVLLTLSCGGLWKLALTFSFLISCVGLHTNQVQHWNSDYMKDGCT